MPGSALVGQPPATDNDKLIHKALLEISPSGINPDFKYPLGPPSPANASFQTRAPSLIIGSSFAIVFVIIVTGARLLVRKFRRHAFGPDDWVIIPAAIGCVVYLSLDIASETAGCRGKHLWECTYDEIGWYVLLGHCNFSIFYFTVFAIKISIVLQNRRITGMTSRNWQIAHWTYLALLVCITPICIFLNTFPCTPIAVVYTLQSIAKLPDPRVIKCLDQEAISLATRTLHIVTDWLLLPVPLIIVYRLQLPVRQKLRLGLVFCIGLISSIATIVRNVLVTHVTTDMTYDYYNIYVWDVVDIFFATIVASLPALNALVDESVHRIKAFYPRLKPGSGKTSASLLTKICSLGSRGNRTAASDSVSNVRGQYSKHSTEQFMDSESDYCSTDIELNSTSTDITDTVHPGSEGWNGHNLRGAADDGTSWLNRDPSQRSPVV